MCHGSMNVQTMFCKSKKSASSRVAVVQHFEKRVEHSQHYNISFLFCIANKRGHDMKRVVSDSNMNWVCRIVLFYGTADLKIWKKEVLWNTSSREQIATTYFTWYRFKELTHICSFFQRVNHATGSHIELVCLSIYWSMVKLLLGGSINKFILQNI